MDKNPAHVFRDEAGRLYMELASAQFPTLFELAEEHKHCWVVLLPMNIPDLDFPYSEGASTFYQRVYALQNPRVFKDLYWEGTEDFRKHRAVGLIFV